MASRTRRSAASSQCSSNSRIISHSGERVVGIAEQFGQRALQGQRHLQQHQHRSVADAVFQVRQVPLGHIGRLRQRLARHAAPSPQRAHAFAELDQEGVLGFLAQFGLPGGWILLEPSSLQRFGLQYSA